MCRGASTSYIVPCDFETYRMAMAKQPSAVSFSSILRHSCPVYGMRMEKES